MHNQPKASPQRLNRSDRAGISQLAKRRMREIVRLRFTQPDEARFSAANSNRLRRYLRAIYMLAGITVVAAVLLIDHFVLTVPTDFFAMRWQVGLGVMTTALLVAFAANILPGGERLSEWSSTAAVVICSLSMLYQRNAAFAWGIDIPTAFIALPIFIGLILCRVRLLALLPFHILIYSLTLTLEFQNDHSRDYQLGQAYSFTLLMTTILAGAWVVEVYNRSTWLRREWLRVISSRDALTGLLNKREFNRELARLFRLAARETRPLTVAMLDVDHFKAYNDHYGHPSGDRCLVKIAEVLRARTRRGGDLVGRVGGEEFALAWYGNDRVTVTMMLEQLVSSVRDLAIEHEYTGSTQQQLTLSAGARWLIPDAHDDPNDVMHEADMLLYESKQAGRNCYRLR